MTTTAITGGGSCRLASMAGKSLATVMLQDTDDIQRKAFHKLRRERHATRNLGQPVEDAVAFRTIMRGWRLWRQIVWVAFDGEDAVGTAQVSVRRRNTQDWTEYAPHIGGGRHIPTSVGGDLYVAKHRNSLLVGRSLMDAIFAYMRRTRRSVLTMSTLSPPVAELLAELGGEQRFHGYVQRLDLKSVEIPRLNNWVSSVDKTLSQFIIERYSGRVPPTELVKLLRDVTQIYQDQPIGSLVIPRITMEKQNYSEWYIDLSKTGGEHHVLTMRADNGELGAVSEVWWNAAVPAVAQQNITAVARQFRGAGLAKAIKALMILHLIKANNSITTLQTFNASDNAAMLAVNKDMGFLRHAELTAFQFFPNGPPPVVQTL